ncbi:MAG: hypothetical protein GXO92_02425 [FCB group bacterium]|nr:hypothetical protein [FCB group bacterium]
MKQTSIILISIIFSCVLFSQEARSVQGAFGAVTIDGKIWNQIALRPVIPIWKFGVALDLVLYIDQDGNIHKDEWDFSSPSAIKNTLIDKIYYVRFGYRTDPVYFKIGALDRVSLGYGILVNGYANTVLYPQVRKVGLEWSVKNKLLSVQGFVNDFKENLGLVGLRVERPLMPGTPVGVSVILDRNQYLGLKDQDDDGRPDLVDDFPNNKFYWVDSDGDGIADNDPLEWDIDGDGITDTLDSRIPGWTLDTTIVLDRDILRRDEPLNIKEDRDPVGAIALDIGFPIVVESNMSVSIYAQAAKMIGKTWDPEKKKKVSTGSGIIPVGIATRFGPARFNLEYRMIPRGRFEFGYWNQSYQIERASISTSGEGTGQAGNVTAIITKESSLGRYGPLKGFYALLSLDLGKLIMAEAAYQNLSGEIWDEDTQEFSYSPNQNFYANLKLQKSISRIKTAKLFYQQRNVPNLFSFEFTESTIMGYRLGLALGSGMVLTYTYQRTFRDLNGDGDVKDENEMVNLTAIETSFTF